MTSRSRVAGRCAIVTGGTRGIGRAITFALLERGASVLLCSRSAGDVARAVDELGKRHEGRVFGVECDVSDSAQVDALFREAVRRLGRIDILINNAGRGSESYVEDMGDGEWLSVLGTNLSGVFYCCRAAVPLMKRAGGGYIINIGSLAGTSGFAGGAAYCATKFGLIGFSESLMQEVRHEHIRVSCVMPGSVNTSFGRHTEQERAKTWKLWPEDVAEVVVDLLEIDPRALASRVELRPSEPKK
ncbi:MAG TPA: SDR family oxidoreductase [Blastocatellia bacterium]|nr:SDR family oxidoreductase [Blastocatellia bacterium]